ncbi:MAG: hypothetical protein KJ670_02980 [Alphaproteobacteria bacterium]|nr:hypothetical protein [Rhizobiaceae bacterium]MBU3961171.1 hypothetical protein [Alphaproteobacteria bacterium]MBU4050939.1 hypothetical protein [Alphaproteobacteria bacterium]MBU4087662.1 hypothetical protein [Alphaproteobacteria bacterium]MBU4155660.1 hypothetical protein [Alphaproteobacteria bacterium]
MATVSEKSFGRFQIGGQEVHGELLINAGETNLYVEDRSYFLKSDLPDFIFGTLQQNEKVTLADCLLPPVLGAACLEGSGRINFANIFPHYIIRGDHFDPNQNVVKTIFFQIDDAEAIFPDRQAFGLVLEPETKIAALLADQDHGAIGERPEILYFSGKHEIFECSVPAGKLSASHGFSMSHPGVKGFKIDNSIRMQFVFDTAKDLRGSLDPVWSIAQLFGLLAGRPQHIFDIRIVLVGDDERKPFLKVLPTTARTFRDGDRATKPHSRDALLNGVQHPETLAGLISSWFCDEAILGHARRRFFNAFDQQNNFDVNRIIAAANLYDLIPESVNPVSKSLPQEIQDVVDKCKALFDALPSSPERSAGLSSLGRMNSANLKKKILAWSEGLRGGFNGKFKDLQLVLDQAVDCRNYFVHGSAAKFDYIKNIDQFIFLIETLEFTFALSYLLRGGWREKMWLSNGGGQSHCFGRYLYDFDRNVSELGIVLRGGEREG